MGADTMAAFVTQTPLRATLVLSMLPNQRIVFRAA
jgi:hypothetical protein